MTNNPYVQGPTLERHLCTDPEPHVQHIVRDDDGEFLCDGRGPKPLAIARWLAMQEYAVQVTEIAEEEGVPESVFDNVDVVSEPVDPGPWSGAAPASDQYLHMRIDWNMTNHAPANDDVVARFEALREFAKSFAHAIVDLCPASRDRELALEHAEDALMRAVAAIARNQSRMEPFYIETGGFDDSLVGDEIPDRPCVCPHSYDEDGGERLEIDESCPRHGVPNTESEDGFASADDLEAAATEALTRNEHDHDGLGPHSHAEDQRPERTSVSDEVGTSATAIDVPVEEE
jgi:hypothetical protein